MGVEAGSLTGDSMASNATVATACELIGLGCDELMRRLDAGERCDYGHEYVLQCVRGYVPVTLAPKMWSPGTACSEFYTVSHCHVQVGPGPIVRAMTKHCRDLLSGPEHCEEMVVATENFRTSSPADRAEELEDAMAFGHLIMDMKRRSNPGWIYFPNIRHIIYQAALSVSSLKDMPDPKLGDKLGPFWNALLSYCETMAQRERDPHVPDSGYDKLDVEECPGLTMMADLAPHHPALAAVREGLPKARTLARLTYLGVMFLDSSIWQRLVQQAGYTDYTESWDMLKNKATELAESAASRGATELGLAVNLAKTRHELFGGTGPEGGRRQVEEVSALEKLEAEMLAAKKNMAWPFLRSLQRAISRAQNLGAIEWVDANVFQEKLILAEKLADRIEGTLSGQYDDVETTTTTTKVTEYIDFGNDEPSVEVEQGDHCEGGYVLQDGTCVMPNTIVDVTEVMKKKTSIKLEDRVTYRCCCVVRDGAVTCDLKDESGPKESRFLSGCGGLMWGSHSWNNKGELGIAGAGQCRVPFGRLPLVVVCFLWGDVFMTGICTREAPQIELKDLTPKMSGKTMKLKQGEMLCCCSQANTETLCELHPAIMYNFKCGNVRRGLHSWNTWGQTLHKNKNSGKCVVPYALLPPALKKL